MKAARRLPARRRICVSACLPDFAAAKIRHIDFVKQIKKGDFKNGSKKIYESGKLHGVYRCGKREELVNKIPRIDKEGMPDVTGIVISGIMNFGNDADMIKAMAKDAIGCKAEDIKIPYDESQFARRRFINDVIVGKLTGSVRFSTQALIDTFYEFLEMPTETTKQMQAKDDLRDIERYLNNETRRPIVLGHPIINLCGANFECQMDFAFLGAYRKDQ